MNKNRAKFVVVGLEIVVLVVPLMYLAGIKVNEGYLLLLLIVVSLIAGALMIAGPYLAKDMDLKKAILNWQVFIPSVFFVLMILILLRVGIAKTILEKLINLFRNLNLIS